MSGAKNTDCYTAKICVWFAHFRPRGKLCALELLVLRAPRRAKLSQDACTSRRLSCRVWETFWRRDRLRTKGGNLTGGEAGIRILRTRFSKSVMAKDFWHKS